MFSGFITAQYCLVLFCYFAFEQWIIISFDDATLKRVVLVSLAKGVSTLRSFLVKNDDLRHGGGEVHLATSIHFIPVNEAVSRRGGKGKKMSVASIIHKKKNHVSP